MLRFREAVSRKLSYVGRKFLPSGSFRSPISEQDEDSTMQDGRLRRRINRDVLLDPAPVTAR